MTIPDSFTSQSQSIRAEGQSVLTALEGEDPEALFAAGQSEIPVLTSGETIRSPIKVQVLELAQPKAKLAAVVQAARNFSTRVTDLINQPNFAKARHDLSYDLGGVVTIVSLCEIYAQTGNRTEFVEAFGLLKTALKTSIELLDGVSAYSSPEDMEVSVYSLDKLEMLLVEVVSNIGQAVFPDQNGAASFTIQADSLPSNYVRANTGVVINFLRNAIHNARKHGGATACHVRLVVVEGSLQITVLDNGKGIDESRISLDEIFDVGKSTGSTGLGLARVPELLSRFNASVTVTAQNTNDQSFPGARFDLQLPLVRK